MKIGIIGCGDIGMNLAEILGLRGYDVIIYNRYHAVEDKPSPYWLTKEGKIMDMNDSLQIQGCGNVRLVSDLDELSICKLIAITAGVKRKSYEETREELTKRNAKVIESYVELISKNPNILNLIISNPVDLLTQYLIKKVSKHTGKTIKETASKIVGVSYVDSMRLRNLIKDHLSKYISTDQLGYDIFAIGEHGPSMVPLIDHIHIGDRVIDSILSESEIQHVRQDTILRGNDIIKLTGASSVLGPSHAAVYMIDKIVKSNESIIPASVWDGTRAIGRVAKFVDCSFHSIIDVNMSDREKELLYRSQDNIDIYYQNLFGKD